MFTAIPTATTAESFKKRHIPKPTLNKSKRNAEKMFKQPQENTERQTKEQKHKEQTENLKKGIIYPNMPVITLKVNCLHLPVKRERLVE